MEEECTKIRCPMQFDKIDPNCNVKECEYRTVGFKLTKDEAKSVMNYIIDLIYKEEE